MQRPFMHPSVDAITLEGILYALADPVRLQIIRRIRDGTCAMNCSEAAPEKMAKSTQSHHFQVLREAGLIRSERRGVEVINSLRCDEIGVKFPGLVPAILTASELRNGLKKPE
jgi:DNA-binding transcriptional ArsR family regulator